MLSYYEWYIHIYTYVFVPMFYLLLSWSFPQSGAQAVEYFIKKRFDELGLEKYKAQLMTGSMQLMRRGALERTSQ